jgi:2-methylcitrate dehydratase PrpD
MTPQYRVHVTQALARLARITKSLDPAVDAAFPGRRGARIQVRLRDGRTFEHLQHDRKGAPELPRSDADLEGKLLALAGPAIGEEGSLNRAAPPRSRRCRSFASPSWLRTRAWPPPGQGL